MADQLTLAQEFQEFEAADQLNNCYTAEDFVCPDCGEYKNPAYDRCEECQHVYDRIEEMILRHGG